METVWITDELDNEIFKIWLKGHYDDLYDYYTFRREYIEMCVRQQLDKKTGNELT